MVARVSSNEADVVVCASTYICRSVTIFTCTHPLYVLPLSAMTLSVPGVIRGRHTSLASEPERERAQYCYTTLNTLSYTLAGDTYGNHRGAHFIDASALCDH